jgi:uncharacterized membrane protein
MKLEVTRGIECGSNRVKLRLNVEMRMIMGVVNVEMRVEMVMLKGLVLLLFFLLLFILLITLLIINLNLLFQLPLFLSYNFSL